MLKQKIFILTAVMALEWASAQPVTPPPADSNAPLASIAGVARELSQGNTSLRIGLQRGDELGQLGASLDSMADALDSRLRIQKNLSDIMQSVIVADEIISFARSILQKMSDITSATHAAFYLHDPKENRLVMP